MKKQRANCTYFIEELTVSTWLLSLFPFIMTRLKQQKMVYYIDGSRIGLYIAQIMSKWLKIKVELFQFRMVDVRDEEGNLLSLRVFFRDLGNLQDDILNRPIFGKIIRTIGVNNRIETFLRRQAIFDKYLDRDMVFRPLILLQYALWKIRENNNKSSEVVFFMNRRLWRDEIDKYAAHYGIKIIWTRSTAVNVRAIILSLFKLAHLRWLKTLKNYIMNELILKPFKGRNVSRKLMSSYSFSRVNPRLAVEYYGHFNLDRPELFSDLFFWHQSSLCGEDIILTFGLVEDPLTLEKVKQIKLYSINAVVLNPKASVVPSFPIFYHWPSILRHKQRFDIPNSPEKRWGERQIERYRADYGYWQYLFGKTNIKIYVTWFKHDAHHCVIADALQSLGGVTAIYQRSFEEFPSPSRAIASDIVFGFSSKNADVEQKSKSVIPYHVTVGFYGDHRFPLLSKLAQETRNKLQKKGAKHILAFFDENSADDARWISGHDFMKENYKFLLEKLLDEPWLGVVLKPKVPATLRKRLGPIAGLLKRAEQTGRCFVFEERRLQNSYSPAVAALASDIAIHGHLYAATAGLESALAGVPTLLLDREGWPISSLYKLGKGRVVFTDWQDLWRACKEHWKTPSGIPGFGDWPSMLDELDPFRDGRAAERIGTYLKWLLDGFKAGLSREVVMADAAQRYVDIWGKDKINAVKGDCYIT